MVADNIIILDNVGSKNPIRLYNNECKVKDALVIKMSYDSDRLLIRLVFNALKYLLRQTKEFDEAFREANC